MKKFARGILSTEDAKDNVPDSEFFKGFWAFALWGYIPPPGYEEFKCALINTIVDDVKQKQ